MVKLEEIKAKSAKKVKKLGSEFVANEDFVAIDKSAKKKKRQSMPATLPETKLVATPKVGSPVKVKSGKKSGKKEKVAPTQPPESDSDEENVNMAPPESDSEDEDAQPKKGAENGAKKGKKAVPAPKSQDSDENDSDGDEDMMKSIMTQARQDADEDSEDQEIVIKDKKDKKKKSAPEPEEEEEDMDTKEGSDDEEEEVAPPKKKSKTEKGAKVTEPAEKKPTVSLSDVTNEIYVKGAHTCEAGKVLEAVPTARGAKIYPGLKAVIVHFKDETAADSFLEQSSGSISIDGEVYAVTKATGQYTKYERPVGQKRGEDSNQLFIRGFGEGTTEDDLKAHFPKGIMFKLFNDKGFVHFDTHEDAEEDMNSAQGSDVNGGTLEIEFAKPRGTGFQNRDGGGFRGNQRGGGRGFGGRGGRGGDRNSFGGGGFNNQNNSFGDRQEFELIVKNLGANASENEIRSHFPAAFKVKLMNNGKCFVKFNQKEEAESAMSEVNGSKIGGSACEIEYIGNQGGAFGSGRGGGGGGFGGRGGRGGFGSGSRGRGGDRGGRGGGGGRYFDSPAGGASNNQNKRKTFTDSDSD